MLTDHKPNPDRMYRPKLNRKMLTHQTPNFAEFIDQN